MPAGGSAARVLMIVENLPVPFDRRVWQEAGALRRAGYEVSIICPTGRGHEQRFEVRDGIRIHRHPLPAEGNGLVGYAAEYGAALFWETVLAWKVFLTGRFDVIHVCSPPDDMWLVAAPFKLLAGVKVVFDHHDLSPELYEAKFEGGGARHRLLRRLLLSCERWAFRVADASIATNDSYRQVAVTRGRMPPERVFVVRSGPSLDRMKSVAPREEWKRGRRYLVGYVGVMGKQEGVAYLLAAARHVVRTLGRKDVHFGLVGDGPEAPALRWLAREQGLDEFVTFTGRVPDPDLLEILSTADVCVSPDVYNTMNDKSTMNKIMEYMALGKPVVLFDLHEGRVSAGAAALYAKPNDPVDLADKIVGLLDDPARRAEMGRIGRARVEGELEWKYEEPKLLAAYARLLGR